MTRSILIFAIGAALLGGCADLEQSLNIDQRPGKSSAFAAEAPLPGSNARLECVRQDLRQFGRNDFGYPGLGARGGSLPHAGRDNFFSYQNCIRRSRLDR